jgi:hypothetical protein
MFPDLQEPYFFDLRMVCGGYAYYATHTFFKKFTTNGREVRGPDLVNVKVFAETARLFGQDISIIRSAEKYNDWLYRGGWAIVEENMAKSNMKQWLKSAECIKAPIGIYTDVEIVSPSALKHYTKRGRKKHVLSRDKETCLACGLTETHGVKLTMHHVLAFTKGGETTARNLVTLCEGCNEKLETQEVTKLYAKAGLHFGYDPSIIRGRLSRVAYNKAIELSDNLMQTRCETW